MNEFDSVLEQDNSISSDISVEDLSEQSLENQHLFNDMIGEDMEQDFDKGSNLQEPEKILENTSLEKYQVFESLDPQKPVNLNELVREQGNLLQNLNNKAQRFENMNLDEEGKGLIADFKNQLLALDEKTIKIMQYFGENISNEDRALINRTLLLKNSLSELYDLLKFFESKDYIAKTKEFEKKFKNLVRSSKERVENFENNLKKYLDTSMPSYNDILKDFIQRTSEFLENFYNEQQNKGIEFKKQLNEEIELSNKNFKCLATNFEFTSKKLKHFALVLLFGFGSFGILFGIISAITYLKYQEYQEIEAKMHSINERISNITIKKDENNNIILSLPKTNTILDTNSDKSKFHITIKEVQR